MKAPPARGPWRTPRPAQRHHPRPRRRSSPRRRAAERPRDHGHGTRPSPTQTAPRGGRSRDHLVGGGRSASHVPYPHLAGRASWPGGHRGDGGERGGAQQPFLSIELSNGFSRAQSLPRRPLRSYYITMHSVSEALSVCARYEISPGGPPWWGLGAVPAPPGHRCDQTGLPVRPQGATFTGQPAGCSRYTAVTPINL